MGILVRLRGYGNQLLGVSWASPIKAALFGTGAGDYHSPISFTATPEGKNRVVLSGTGLPSISNASQVRAVRAYAADGKLVGEWRPSRTTQFVYNELTAVLAVSGADWSSAASLDVEIHAEHRGWAPAESAWQHYIVNPIHAYLATGTNTAAAQGNGTTTYYWDLNQYKFEGFQIDDTPGIAGDNTYVVSATWQDDGTADDACSYKPIMTSWFGFASVTSAQITADQAAGVLEINTPITARYVRMVVTRANDGANTDGGWDIFRRKKY
jgi:hypothetical protein